MSIFIYTGAIIGGVIINETYHYFTSQYRDKYIYENNVGYINVNEHIKYEPFEYIYTDDNGIELNNECKINNDCKINNKKNFGFNILKDIQKFDVSSLHSTKNKNYTLQNTSIDHNSDIDHIKQLSLFDELKLRLKQKRPFIHTEFNIISNDNNYDDFDDFDD